MLLYHLFYYILILTSIIDVLNASRDNKWIKQACKVPDTFGTEQYLQWNADFIKAIANLHSESIRRVINPCRLHLEVLHALLTCADVLLDKIINFIIFWEMS